MNSKESSVSLWKLMPADIVSRYPKLLGRMDLLNAMAELDIRQPNGSSVEDTNCHGHFWMKSKVVN